MRINEKDQQIEKCERIDFDECSKYGFGDTPYKKDQNIEKCKTTVLMNGRNNFSGETRVYLMDIFSAQILRALSSNKNGILYF